MAGELKAVMEALGASLAASCPGRFVSRDFLPLGQRTADELEAGILAVAALGESGFANYRGREADLGTLRVVIVGQIKVADESPPHVLEDAEFAFAEQVKAWLGMPMLAPVRQCLARSYRQSGQLEHPYGWVAFECEVKT
ncbi:hypothetical protein [Thauera propionica]|uniref:hypothetical protein n=1 Tax=Thauera propionica TaxID=2019431 RepID=UPI0023F10F4A|nr:hypothetical protein [Thauera propionica]MDD3675804.1 hypothetical protein [Thauera propionica]